MKRYIYLDDEPIEAVRPYIRAVENAGEGLAIEHRHPQQYPKQMETLREEHLGGALDGLILDLRLDQFPNLAAGDKRADYRASTLAQEIRTRATEGVLPEFPIVLLSTDERLRRSYVNDDTSHDLFDVKSLKERIEDPVGAARLSAELIALVEGYKRIGQAHSRKRGVNRGLMILGIDEQPPYLDPRILNHFLGRDGTPPIHEVARFVLRELLDTPGPLIDSGVLAARMGIDQGRSPGFKTLVDRLNEASYQGAFAAGWPRWWAAGVESAWRAMGNASGSLRTTPSAERVAYLRKELKIRDLVPATAFKPSSSTMFWTICRASGDPLDPKEGFLVDRQPKFPWQDRVYVSLTALLDGTARSKGLRIDPLENDRFIRARTRLNVR
ncbi:MAG TPA: hypothetical protein VF665_17525 [Longimicrobium sp.]|uniref:hypothetical protein n=1 Tax=Longimicrobium sp. TaxID=2029185 RepID=UPI002EDA11D0